MAANDNLKFTVEAEDQATDILNNMINILTEIAKATNRFKDLGQEGFTKFQWMAKFENELREAITQMKLTEEEAKNLEVMLSQVRNQADNASRGIKTFAENNKHIGQLNQTVNNLATVFKKLGDLAGKDFGDPLEGGLKSIGERSEEATNNFKQLLTVYSDLFSAMQAGKDGFKGILHQDQAAQIRNIVNNKERLLELADTIELNEEQATHFAKALAQVVDKMQQLNNLKLQPKGRGSLGLGIKQILGDYQNTLRYLGTSEHQSFVNKKGAWGIGGAKGFLLEGEEYTEELKAARELEQLQKKANTAKKKADELSEQIAEKESQIAKTKTKSNDMTEEQVNLLAQANKLASKLGGGGSGGGGDDFDHKTDLWERRLKSAEKALAYRKSEIKYARQLASAQDVLIKKSNQYLDIIERLQRSQPGYGRGRGLLEDQAAFRGGSFQRDIALPILGETLKSGELHKVVTLTKLLNNELGEAQKKEKQLVEGAKDFANATQEVARSEKQVTDALRQSLRVIDQIESQRDKAYGEKGRQDAAEEKARLQDLAREHKINAQEIMDIDNAAKNARSKNAQELSQLEREAIAEAERGRKRRAAAEAEAVKRQDAIINKENKQFLALRDIKDENTRKELKDIARVNNAREDAADKLAAQFREVISLHNKMESIYGIRKARGPAVDDVNIGMLRRIDKIYKGEVGLENADKITEQLTAAKKELLGVDKQLEDISKRNLAIKERNIAASRAYHRGTSQEADATMRVVEALRQRARAEDLGSLGAKVERLSANHKRLLADTARYKKIVSEVTREAKLYGATTEQITGYVTKLNNARKAGADILEKEDKQIDDVIGQLKHLVEMYDRMKRQYGGERMKGFKSPHLSITHQPEDIRDTVGPIGWEKPLKTAAAVDKMSNNLKEATQELEKFDNQIQSENTQSLEKMNRQIDRLTRHIQRFPDKFKGAIHSNEKFKEIIKRTVQQMRKYGATNEQVAQSVAKLNNARKGSLVKINEESDRLSRLVKNLSKVNVEYFTYTNILHDVEFGLERASYYTRRMIADIVESGGELEKLEKTVFATESDKASAMQRTQELLNMSVELVGASTKAIFKYNSQLRAAGLTAKQVDMVITGVARSMAQLGKGTEASERVLLQLTQALAGNKIVLQDLRPVLEELPTFWRNASIAFNENIKDIDKLREVIDASGMERKAGLLKILEQINDAAVGADMTSYAAKIDILKDRFFLLRAEMGKALLPMIKSLIDIASVVVSVFSKWGAVSAGLSYALFGLTSVIVGLSVAAKVLMAHFMRKAVFKALGVLGDEFKTIAKIGGLLTKVLGKLHPVMLAIGVAVAALSFVGWKSASDGAEKLTQSLEELRKTSNDLNEAIFEGITLKPIVEGLEDSILQLRQSKNAADKETKGLIKLYEKLRDQTVMIMSDDPETRKAGLNQRLRDLQKQLDAVEEKFISLGRTAGTEEEKLSRMWELRSEAKKLEDSIKLITISLQKTGQEVFDLDTALVNSKWDVIYSEKALKAANSVEEIINAANKLEGALFDQAEKELRNAELKEHEKIDIQRQYTADSLQLEEDRNEAIFDLWEKNYEAYAKIQEQKLKVDKKSADAAIDRVGKFFESWEKVSKNAPENRVKNMTDEMKKLGKVVKENQDKYSDEDTINRLFSRNEKGKQLGYFHDLLRIMHDDSIKSEKERAFQIRAIQERLAIDLKGIHWFNEKKKNDILKEWSGKLQSIINDRYQYWTDYYEKKQKAQKEYAERAVKEENAVANRQEKFDLENEEMSREHRKNLYLWEVEVREKGLAHYEKVEKDKLKAAEKQAKEALKIQEKLYKRFTDMLLDAVFSEGKSFKEMATQFIKSSLRMIAQHYIETEIRVNNEKRVQAEIAKTQALQNKGISDMLGKLGGGSIAGAGVAMAGAGFLAPNQLANVGGGILGLLSKAGKNVSSLPDKIFGVFDDPDNDRYAMAYGKMKARQQIGKAATRSAQDQMDFFGEGFQKEFSSLLKQAISDHSGVGSSGKITLNIEVPVIIGEEEIRRIRYEEEAMVEEDRI